MPTLHSKKTAEYEKPVARMAASYTT